MITVALITYLSLYVVWLLTLVVTGRVGMFWDVTFAFVVMPVMLIIGSMMFLFAMVITPFVAMFNKEYAAKLFEGR